MNKIASPQELQSDLHDLLAYARSARPSRSRIASELQRLANEVIGKEASDDPEALVDSIGRGDRVTIVDRFGKEHTGKAVMKGPAGWVLNMGGRHGTPDIASEKNIVKVKKSKG
jgi:hypothetical protein